MYKENKVLKYYKESHRDAAPLMESVMPSFLSETDGMFQAASLTDRKYRQEVETGSTDCVTCSGVCAVMLQGACVCAAGRLKPTQTVTYRV